MKMNKIASALISAVLTLSSFGASASAMSLESTHPRISTMVTINFSANSEIKGLTSWDSLGKRTGTLEEFANSAITEGTDSYVTFPANFFHSYDDVKDIVGGIYSQGRIVNDSWMDWGCGFDANNKFYLFKLISTITNEPDGKIMTTDENGNEVEIVTGFNCYPWLIQNGQKLDIQPFPGADAPFLNASSQRAFMGQKADGTFIYGMVGGATMTQLRDICADLGLVNAVNTDGGASCGVYANGGYQAVPGRELASVVYIAEKQPETTIIYEGLQVKLNQVLRNGYAFYPLEDILQTFCGGHDWNPETMTLSGTLNDNAVEVSLRNFEYVINGTIFDVPAELIPFVENDVLYVYLDYVVQGLGFSVQWDGVSNTMTVNER